jgi:CheY-like chemotaxis protein
MLRKIYVEILSEAGYQIQDAASADECMQVLSREIPDLILLDIMMKPVDGWATLIQIRDNLPSSQVPVIMISGKAILPQEVTQYGPLIDGYLRKPLQNVTLLNALSDFFTWYEKLSKEMNIAKTSGKDPNLVDSYFQLRREYHSVTHMYGMIQHEYDKTRDSITTNILADSFEEIDKHIAQLTQNIRDIESNLGITENPDFQTPNSH